MSVPTINPGKVTDFAKPKLIWIALALCAVVLWWYFDGKQRFTDRTRVTAGPPQGARGGGETGPSTQMVKVKVNHDCWSDWVRLPANCTFQVDRPGWVEYQYIDGRKKKFNDNTTNWLGTIPENTFRLRGHPGEVVITIQPR